MRQKPHGSELPRDWLWRIVMAFGCAPLLIIEWVGDLGEAVFMRVAEGAFTASFHWKRRVRVWSGRNPEGYTPLEVAHEDAIREEVLRDMRTWNAPTCWDCHDERTP